MKSILTLFSVSALLFMVSCQNGPDQKAAADSTKPVVTAPAKPANVLAVWHKLANYSKWMQGYEAHDSSRLASGLHNYVIGRDLADSNMVLVALKMDDVAKAKSFISAPDLKAAMEKGGVLGKPTPVFLDVQMMDTATNTTTTRIMVTHKVKDYDAWKKVYDEDKQMRMDAGLTDRSLAYSFDDRNEVTLVFAVSDMKKAKDFMNSKALKDKMAAGGVIGAPTVHMYTVAKKW